ARVTGTRLLHRVHGEHADQVHRPGVGCRPLKLGVHRLAAQARTSAFLYCRTHPRKLYPASTRPSSDPIAVRELGYLRTSWLKCLVTQFAELIRRAFAGSSVPPR